MSAVDLARAATALRKNVDSLPEDEPYIQIDIEDPADARKMHPSVALALSSALDNAADAIGHADLCLDCFHPTCLTVADLIPVARLINGGVA